MDEVKTRQGKFVLSGEPVATMGEKRVASATALTLETERPTLYIAFRKDGTPVDSRPWWTAKEIGRARNESSGFSCHRRCTDGCYGHERGLSGRGVCQGSRPIASHGIGQIRRLPGALEATKC